MTNPKPKGWKGDHTRHVLAGLKGKQHINPIDYFTKRIKKYKLKCDKIDAETKYMREGTGHSGGTMSKAFAKRHRSAINKSMNAYIPLQRERIFKSIYIAQHMPDNNKKWTEYDNILIKIINSADLGDSYSYTSALSTIYIFKKKKAIAHFVNKYANKKTQSILFDKTTL